MPLKAIQGLWKLEWVGKVSRYQQSMAQLRDQMLQPPNPTSLHKKVTKFTPVRSL